MSLKQFDRLSVQYAVGSGAPVQDQFTVDPVVDAPLLGFRGCFPTPEMSLKQAAFGRFAAYPEKPNFVQQAPQFAPRLDVEQEIVSFGDDQARPNIDAMLGFVADHRLV